MAGKYAPAKWYVYRLKDGHEGWVGPLSLRRAQAEAAAWASEGYSTRIEGATPQMRALVNRWQREADIRHGRTTRSGKSSYGQLRRRMHRHPAHDYSHPVSRHHRRAS